MLCKFLERRVQITRDGLERTSGDVFELEYYLLESINDEDNNDIKKTYGIEIVKKQNGSVEEFKCFEDIYPSREKAKSLVELLADQTVTPSALPYILDDLMGM